jgi:hypothetical protein
MKIDFKKLDKFQKIHKGQISQYTVQKLIDIVLDEKSTHDPSSGYIIAHGTLKDLGILTTEKL